MDNGTLRPPAWQLQMLNQVVQDTRKSSFLALATQHSKQVNAIAAQMQSPIVTALANLNPLLPVIKTAQETVKQMTEPIRQATEVMAKIGQQLNTVTSIVKAYREMIERSRAYFQHFIKSVNFGLVKAAQKVVETVVLPFHLFRYHIIKRARDGDKDALLLLSQVFSQEYRLYCSIKKLRHTSRFARLEFASSIYHLIIIVLRKTVLSPDRLLSSLLLLFRRLFFALKDWLRSITMKLQQEMANEKSPEECIIERNEQKYLLLPTLSIFTGISEATLRRYCSQGKIEAVKLLYVSPKTHNQNLAWHVPYTPNMLAEIKSFSQNSYRGKLSRKQISERTGIHVDTLRSWERKGLVATQKVNRHVYYLESQLTEIVQLFRTNNSPRYRHLLAKVS